MTSTVRMYKKDRKAQGRRVILQEKLTADMQEQKRRYRKLECLLAKRNDIVGAKCFFARKHAV